MPSRRQPIVLLLDEHTPSLNGLADVLHDHGLRIVCTSNGRQALEALEEGPLPDAILFDPWLIEMKAQAFVDAVRERDAWASIPILALHDRFLDVDHKLTGVHRVIKPITPSGVQRLVADLQSAFKRDTPPDPTDT